MKNKKIVILLITIIMVFSQCHFVYANSDFEFNGFRDHQNVVHVPTPFEKEQSKIVWQQDFTKGYDNLSNLIIVDQYLYFVTGTGNKLMKVDLNGNIVSSTTIDNELVPWNMFITSGEGLIFVGAKNYVVAYNQDTLNKVWTSTKLEGSIEGPLTYYNGYVYVGTSRESSGFYGLKVNSIDFWKYEDSSYYWNQGVIMEDAIIFANEQGEIVCHSLDSSKVYSKITVNEPIVSSPTIKGNKVYISTKSAKLFEFEINHHQIQLSRSLQLKGVDTSSSPTVVGNRLYIGSKTSNNFNSEGLIEVVDIDTWQIKGSYPTLANVQSSPLVSTAYLNKNLVYFTYNGLPGGIKVLVDDLSNDQQFVSDLYVPVNDGEQYCISSVICDGQGNLYHYNDSGIITKLENTSKSSPIDTIPSNLDGTTISGEFYTDTKANFLDLGLDPTIQSMVQMLGNEVKSYHAYQLSIQHDEYQIDQNQIVNIHFVLPEGYIKERTSIYCVSDNKLELISSSSKQKDIQNAVDFQTPANSTIVITQNKLDTLIESDLYNASIQGDLESDMLFEIVKQDVDLSSILHQEINNIKRYSVFDFSLQKNGKVVKLNESVTINFELPYVIDYKDLQVFYLNQGQLQEVECQNDGFSCTFNTEQLGTFVFVEKDNTVSSLLNDTSAYNKTLGIKGVLTGDNVGILTYVGICLIFLGIIILLKTKKNKK